MTVPPTLGNTRQVLQGWLSPQAPAPLVSEFFQALSKQDQTGSLPALGENGANEFLGPALLSSTLWPQPPRTPPPPPVHSLLQLSPVLKLSESHLA